MGDRKVSLSLIHLLSQILDRRLHLAMDLNKAVDMLSEVIAPMKKEGLVSEYHYDKILTGLSALRKPED